MWPPCWAPPRRLGIAELIDPTPSRQRDLVCAMLAAAVIAPDSKLATARGLRAETATSSLGQVLGVCGLSMRTTSMRRWTGCSRVRTRIENTLAARHLANGTLVLYDVSSAAFEGHTCPLGAIGHARDGVKGRLQIVYGLLCSTAGVPVAIEVFDGNTADPKTLAAQIRQAHHPVRADTASPWSAIAACSPARASRDELRPAAPGLAQRPARRPDQSPGRTTTRCSYRCSMSRTSSRSPTPTTPASGWSAATTPP